MIVAIIAVIDTHTSEIKWQFFPGDDKNLDC